MKNQADRIDKFKGVDLVLITFFTLQVVLTVLYIIFMDFTSYPKKHQGEIYGWPTNVEYLYNFVIDLSLMVFVGFGMLSSFMRKYQYSSLGLSLLVAAFSFQWGLLWHGWFEWASKSQESKIKLELDNMVHGLYCATTVLISLGAVLGRLTTMQALIMAFFGSFFYSLNYYICVGEIEATDLGGALTIHLFGACFGLACSLVLGLTDTTDYTAAPFDQKPSYTSDTFAFIGSIVLFVLFPSFNGALAPAGSQFRVVVNTALACCAAALVVIAGDWFGGCQRFRAFVIQNGVISGGVVMGCAHSMVINQFSAIILGCLAGAGTYLGLRFITPLMNRPRSFPAARGAVIVPRDTRGVLFAHGWPAFLGGLAGMIASGSYEDDVRFGQTADQTMINNDTPGGRLAATWVISMAIGLSAGAAFAGLPLWALAQFLPSEFLRSHKLRSVGGGSVAAGGSSLIGAGPGASGPGVGGKTQSCRRFHDEANWRELPLDVDV